MGLGSGASASGRRRQGLRRLAAHGIALRACTCGWCVRAAALGPGLGLRPALLNARVCRRPFQRLPHDDQVKADVLRRADEQGGRSSWLHSLPRSIAGPDQHSQAAALTSRELQSLWRTPQEPNTAMAPLCSLPLPAACCSSRLVQQSAAPAAALPALQQRHQARRRPSAAAAAEPAAAAERAAVPVTFAIAGSEITVDATPGQNLWEVRSLLGRCWLC